MSCPNPVALSRALVAGVDDRLRAHLDTCARCSEELAAHAAIVGATRQLPTFDPSEDHARNVRVSLIRTARTQAPAARPRVVWGFAAAGVLAAAAVLAFVVLREPEPRPMQAASRGTIMPQEGAALLRIGNAPDEVVRIAHGTVSVKVAKLERGERFRVMTGDAELELRDGACDVAVERDHLHTVRVIAGQVILRAQGAPPRTLQAGERWQVELAVAEEPTVPTAHAPPPSKPARKPATKSITIKPTPSAPTTAKRPIELLFEEGWATLAAGNASGAAAIFERAAKSAPNDPLAEDAWFWRASALARAKSPAAANALDAFIARYPNSPRLGEASAMLGWLVIDSDLDRAEKLFKAAAADRVGAVRASANKGLAAIEQRRKRR